jgi:hypothetical protein
LLEERPAVRTNRHEVGRPFTGHRHNLRRDIADANLDTSPTTRDVEIAKASSTTSNA